MRILALIAALLLCANAALAQNIQPSGGGGGGGGSGGITVGAAITGTCPNGQVVYSNSGNIGCQAVSGTGTVTSVATGCAATGGTITTSGTIKTSEAITARTSGNYATGDCGTLVNYNSAGDQTPTIPLAATAGAGLYFDTCNIQHAQTITPSGADTIGLGSTYLLRAGTAAVPTCVRLTSDGTSNWAILLQGGAAQVFQQPIETEVALSGCNGSTATMDLTKGSYFACTISTGAVTMAVSNPAASGLVSSFTLELTNGGSQTITWMSGTKWPGGTAPTLTAGGVDLLVCSTRDGATTWRCVGSEINSH